MSVGSSPYVLVFGALFLAWAGLSAYVLVTRALFDFRHLAFHGARRIVGHRLARAGTDVEREQVLRRLPRRTLAGIASDANVDPRIAAVAARVLLERRFDLLRRRGLAHRNESEKWRRIAVLRIFSIAGHPDAVELLQRALCDDDSDVVGAAVALLGERDDREATRLLVDALAADRFSRSRIPTHLDGRDAVEELLPLVDHRDEGVRYWAATLLAPSAERPSVELALASLVGDPSPNVRATVAKAFAGVGGDAAGLAATALLRDGEWFVRAAATRALAASGATGIAELLAPLLRDEQWWVRTAAKEALAAVGREAANTLARLLSDDDEFARNGAAEVSFSSGLVARWSGEAASDSESARLLREALAAGGPRLQDAALATASGERRQTIERLIRSLPESRSA